MTSTDTMNFGTLLLHMDHYSGELVHHDYGETPYSWEYDAKEQALTDIGKERFKSIMESDFLLCKDCIILTSDRIDIEDYNLFLAACAGYCDADDYARWFR